MGLAPASPASPLQLRRQSGDALAASQRMLVGERPRRRPATGSSCMLAAFRHLLVLQLRARGSYAVQRADCAHSAHAHSSDVLWWTRTRACFGQKALLHKPHLLGLPASACAGTRRHPLSPGPAEAPAAGAAAAPHVLFRCRC